jgi:ubiquinone/menaquinone biosynthesis C-methylase UbiE
VSTEAGELHAALTPCRDPGDHPTLTDPSQAVVQYKEIAESYDRRLALRISRGAQRRAVERLNLRPDQRVLDVACGTGINFAAIERAIGSSGRLVGVDVSEEMLGQAGRRVAMHRWENVQLVRSSVEDVVLDGVFDAALLSFTHDVLRSPAALDNVIRHIRQAGKVAAAGVMYPGGALRAARPLVRRATRPYVTTLDGLECPWDALRRRLLEVRVERLLLGTLYVISGDVREQGTGA